MFLTFSHDIIDCLTLRNSDRINLISDLREQEVGLHQVEPRGLREDEGRRPSPT